MRINERIMAVYVLQRFVRMSRELLPLYFDLSNKLNKSKADMNSIIGIKQIYDNFRADPIASKYLINSNILSLIQKVYHSNCIHSGQTAESLHEYDKFIEESDRLIAVWDKQLMN